MSVGTGIFLGAVFIGLIYLYVNTKETWAWRKIIKRAMLTFVSLIVASGMVIGAVIAYDSYQAEQAIQEKEKPRLVDSLEGVSIGQKISDVGFNVSVKRTPDRDDENELAYAHTEKDHVRFYFDKSTKLVSQISFKCTDDALQYPTLYSAHVHGIQCGSSSEDILSTYSEGQVRVLCFNMANDDTGKFSRFRAYDVPEYGVRYILQTNKVSSIVIMSPKRLSEEQNTIWKACE